MDKSKQLTLHAILYKNNYLLLSKSTISDFCRKIKKSSYAKYCLCRR